MKKHLYKRSMFFAFLCVCVFSGCLYPRPETHSDSCREGRFISGGKQIVCIAPDLARRLSLSMVNLATGEQCVIKPYAVPYALSRDRQHLAFVDYKDKSLLWIFDIYERVFAKIDCSWLQPEEWIIAVSPDFERVVVQAPGLRFHWPTFVVGIDGQGRQDITSNGKVMVSWRRLGFSPCGRYLLYRDSRYVYLHDYEENATREFHYEASDRAGKGGESFSPDSLSMVLTKSNTLIVASLDGTKAETIFVEPLEPKKWIRPYTGSSIQFPQFSPDGNSIVFWANLDNARGLHMIDKDGSNMKHLCEALPTGFDFSPDGRSILYEYGHLAAQGLSDSTRELRIVDVASGLVTTVSVTSVRSDCFHADGDIR